MADNTRSELMLTFKSLFESGKYSDFVITCGSETYYVHRAVVCARSDFFERTERFAIGKEHDEGKVDLPEDEPAEYDRKLSDGGQSNDGGPTQLLLHAKMYEIGDKDDVKGLKDLARDKFLRRCNEYWDDYRFTPAAHHVFTTTPDEDVGLRSIVTSMISPHIELLNKPIEEALLHYLLASGKYADLVITCGDDRYNVHKAIVCYQSGFFDRAKKFPVGKESAEGVDDLPEGDPLIPTLPPDCFVQMDGSWTINDTKKDWISYKFPHSCNYGKDCGMNICPHHTCKWDSCRSKCEDFMCDTCIGPQPAEGDASQLLLHAKILSKAKFARACKKYWADDEFYIATEDALTTTPSSDQGLREILHDMIAIHSELLDEEGIQELLKAHPGFMFGVIKRQAKQMDNLKSGK
ncbi:hypothetical protein EK21DRAFT_105378 [Setomelanomma holmii]|uniref:BTB domain-containing protein n=1 Tax=Setomelanomma holmii TaxID=210430 RepID=A0A9P4GV78_9PLEO|nr:hypothetical protein EK21DRAFT_105378 [Setomelanomma holmii]